MNERIQKLAEQAKGTKTPGYPVWRFYNSELEKFAELIVRECANRLMQDDFGSIKGQMRIAGAKLKEHFELE